MWEPQRPVGPACSLLGMLPFWVTEPRGEATHWRHLLGFRLVEVGLRLAVGRSRRAPCLAPTDRR